MAVFRRFARALAGASIAVLIAAAPATAREPAPPAWPDTTEARLAALALIQTLNATLLSTPSATLTLDRWCADHALAPAGSKIVAERVKGAEKPADADIRAALGATPEERIVHRRVRLTCGGRVLSEADNWYRPGQLTEAMNRELETTDTAFGRVVKPLGFSRTTLDAKLVWHPLPDGWEMLASAKGTPTSKPGEILEIPQFVLAHRAVLKKPDGTAFSLVAENYTSEILAFPPPLAPRP